MDRKDFFKIVWKKGIIPTLLLATIVFCLVFLYNVFTESGTERIITIIILGIGTIYALMYLLVHFLKLTWSKIDSILPQKLRILLKVSIKIFSYLTPIITGIIIYHFWQQDWKAASLVIGILMILKIIELIKEEKQLIT